MDIHVTVNGRPPRFCPFEECNTLLTSPRYKSCRRHVARYDMCLELARSLVERHGRKPILGLGRFSPKEVAIDLLMKRVNEGSGIILGNDPEAREAAYTAQRRLTDRGDFVDEVMASLLLTEAGWPN